MTGAFVPLWVAVLCSRGNVCGLCLGFVSCSADEPDNAEFWGALGGDASQVAPASSAGDDAAVATTNETHLYHISNATGEMAINEVPPQVRKRGRGCVWLAVRFPRCRHRAVAATDQPTTRACCRAPSLGEPVQKSLPAPWQEVQDESGATYYFNTETQESAWERPPGPDGEVRHGLMLSGVAVVAVVVWCRDVGSNASVIMVFVNGFGCTKVSCAPDV